MRPLLPKQPQQAIAAPVCSSSVGPSNSLEVSSNSAAGFRVPPPRDRALSESRASGSAEVPQKPKAKRVVVSNACVPCRKRRSKCDGNHPCGKCLSLSREEECMYDAENDHRRKGALRRENDDLKRKNRHLDAILSCIATSGDEDIEVIIKRIRTGEKFEDIANGIQSKDNTDFEINANHATNSEGSEESDLSDRDTTPPITAVRPSSWTEVTDDDEFVMELIDLYFTWHHPFFLYFSESRFRADFATGRTANCSPLLVNAILATACHYSSRPQAREDPENDDSIGEHFCKETKRLLQTLDGRKPITTIQALPVMAVRESGCRRDLVGFCYLSMAYRLVCDKAYNEHLVPKQLQTEDNDADEEAWRITFWGCYCLETAWNFGLGKINLENKLAKWMPKPIPTDESEWTPWVPYTGLVPKHNLASPGPCRTYAILNQHIALCEIIQDITAWLYGKKPFKAGTLLGFHARLQRWQAQLPEELREVTENSVPGLFYLHEYHRIVVLALFKPFYHLPFEPAKNFMSPRELSTLAARDAAQLLRKHQQHHGMTNGLRYSNGMIYQFLIPMCNARKLELHLPDACEDYRWGIQAMKEAGEAWPFGKAALLSMVEIQDIPEKEKKPSGDAAEIMEKFEGLTIEKKTELTHESEYYAIIVENNWGGLAPDFEYHWRHAWAEYISELRTDEKPPGIVKKPSVESLLN